MLVIRQGSQGKENIPPNEDDAELLHGCQAPEECDEQQEQFLGSGAHPGRKRITVQH